MITQIITGDLTFLLSLSVESLTQMKQTDRALLVVGEGRCWLQHLCRQCFPTAPVLRDVLYLIICINRFDGQVWSSERNPLNIGFLYMKIFLSNFSAPDFCCLPSGFYLRAVGLQITMDVLS